MKALLLTFCAISCLHPVFSISDTDIDTQKQRQAGCITRKIFDGEDICKSKCTCEGGTCFKEGFSRMRKPGSKTWEFDYTYHFTCRVTPCDFETEYLTATDCNRNCACQEDSTCLDTDKERLYFKCHNYCAWTNFMTEEACSKNCRCAYGLCTQNPANESIGFSCVSSYNPADTETKFRTKDRCKLHCTDPKYTCVEIPEASQPDGGKTQAENVYFSCKACKRALTYDTQEKCQDECCFSNYTCQADAGKFKCVPKCDTEKVFFTEARCNLSCNCADGSSCQPNIGTSVPTFKCTAVAAVGYSKECKPGFSSMDPDECLSKCSCPLQDGKYIQKTCFTDYNEKIASSPFTCGDCHTDAFHYDTGSLYYTPWRSQAICSRKCPCGTCRGGWDRDQRTLRVYQCYKYLPKPR